MPDGDVFSKLVCCSGCPTILKGFLFILSLIYLSPIFIYPHMDLEIPNSLNFGCCVLLTTLHNIFHDTFIMTSLKCAGNKKISEDVQASYSKPKFFN